MRATIRQINEALLSTLAACGDVERNVLCCPAPLFDPVRDDLNADAAALGFALRPAVVEPTGKSGSTARRSRPCRRPASPQVPTPGDDPVEPIYGKTYLPRKFKTAFALPEDNCTDIHANDLGFLGVVEDGRLVGYNVLVGGGLGTTPSAQKTFPFLARAALLRRSRRRARDRRGGPQGFSRLRQPFRPQASPAQVHHSRLGNAGLPRQGRRVPRSSARRPEAGRRSPASTITWAGTRKATASSSWASRSRTAGSRTTATFGSPAACGPSSEKYKTPARLTCQQSILLADLEPAWRGEIERWLAEYGIATVEQISTVRRWSMACPALPTCGLAVTEAERALPGLLDQLEVELARLGPGERAVHGADDRLPQRLCPPL